MSRYHQHTSRNNNLRAGGSPQSYAAVVGTVEVSTERPIQGRNGDHLQFYLDVGNGSAYQVDVNTQSRDGSQIGLYIAEEDFDIPEDLQPGRDGDAALSYGHIGLTDDNFVATDYTRIERQLTADLNRSQLVVAYGLSFQDPGPNGAGIHETHFTGRPNQDGALALYIPNAPGAQAKRVWYFFKFGTDSIAA
ncbi:MAG TPA: hypothetical protein VF472_03965 [Burkholderiaceae bacterium]